MQNIYKLAALSTFILLAACQTTPRSYNGVTGYSIESQSDTAATLAYTLAGRQNQQLDANKLQAACQKVLGQHKNYQIKVLSINEIANPKQSDEAYGRQIGNSRTSFALSNTKELHSEQNYATLQALEASPSTLHVVRYTCSS
jgi:starvation-inducible outer membrane lipoprotein